MPTVISINVVPCAASSTGRIIETVQDTGGTGIIQWSADGGWLPVNMSNFEVYENGKRLDYVAEYTAQQYSAYAVITITVPVPGAFYTMIKYLL